jgi:hypothetical protein
MSGEWKRRGASLAAMACAVIFATGIAYGDLQIGYYAPATLGRLAQPASPVQRPDDVYSVGAYSLFTPQLAPGEGRQDAEAYCSTCHTPSYITMQPPLPAATWEAEVTKMQKAFGMDIPADAQARILKYLETHYTPETRKR